MSWTSILAIYLLFWSLSLFIILPIGVRTSDEAGETKVKGQAESAPVRPMMWRKVLWTTILSAVLMAGFWLMYSAGWFKFR